MYSFPFRLPRVKIVPLQAGAASPKARLPVSLNKKGEAVLAEWVKLRKLAPPEEAEECLSPMLRSSSGELSPSILLKVFPEEVELEGGFN